jgi:polyisoprenoid-binding protein YceI
MWIASPCATLGSMIPPPGSYSFGPQNGRILVKTYREGFASAIGHDLVIEVGEWSASVTVAEDPSETTITARADVDSLNPIEGVGGVKPLTDADKAEIKKNIRKVLTSPDISFQSTSVKAAGDSATVSGYLTIMGRRDVVEVSLTESGGKVRGNFSVLQTRWGIKPYTAMFGALRVADRVDVEFEVDAPA